MIFVIDKDTLNLDCSYDDSLYIITKMENKEHLPLPENLDPDCIKAVATQEEVIVDGLPILHTTYSLVEDPDKVAAKTQAVKDAQILLLRAQCDADIEAQQLAVYGTKNQSAALATQQSWSDIEANPERYVPMMFPTLEDATFWITPKMTAARQFAAWRFQRIVTRDAEIAAL